MPEPSQARTARYRARLAGALPPLPRCLMCGRVVSSLRTAPLCSICWKGSVAGRAANAARMAAKRKTQRQPPIGQDRHIPGNALARFEKPSQTVLPSWQDSRQL